MRVLLHIFLNITCYIMIFLEDITHKNIYTYRACNFIFYLSYYYARPCQRKDTGMVIRNYSYQSGSYTVIFKIPEARYVRGLI